jgi:CheY-like chemotaxis protein
MRAHFIFAEPNHLTGRIENVDRRLWLHGQAEYRAVIDGVLVQEQIVAMEVDPHAERALRVGHARHVIDVRVCQQDVTDGEGVSLGIRQQLIDFIAGVDQDRLPGRLTAQNEPVLEERGHSATLNYHEGVILAVVDDLMFASKIKTTAGQLGVPVTFARSRDSALAEMRKSAPALVIFDLNSGRTDPLGTVAAMKGDPALAAIPTVGFVSHVRTDVIDAARQAGVGEILARSAFTMQLPEILTRGSG